MFLSRNKKISEFLSENFHFLVVNFSVYLNRVVFVMQSKKPQSNQGLCCMTTYSTIYND